MSHNNLRLIAGLTGVIVFLNPSCLVASNPPVSQLMSSQERAREMQQESQKLQKQARQPKPSKPKEAAPPQTSELPGVQKILVTKINVTGVTLFSLEKINAITAPYENKELGLDRIQKVADLITDLYRQKGYITSRAYVPPQKIEGGIIEIKVIEAKVGEIQIKGNQYFSQKLINSYLTLKSGDVFNYTALKADLERINGHPDRTVKAVLAPGNMPGTTDVVLNEKDLLPVHISLGYDNFISYYLRRNEYTTTFTDNNLLGKDDILTVSYNRGDGNDFYYYSGRYLYPVTHRLNMGFFYVRSNMALTRDLVDLGSRGESKIYSIFGNEKIIKNDNLDFDLTFGFDYKNVDNYLQGNLSSRDYLRIPKAGFDFDRTDNWGRTIIADEADFGIPGIMGGAKKNLNANDIPTSRDGAGGRFFLDTLNLLRLQNLPFDATLLWKNQLQFSSSKLTATEEFQAGGPVNNRGFSIVDKVGDAGYAMSWELAIPPYFIPKVYQIPFLKTNAYQALRFIGFYDWTNVHLNTIQPGERKNTTLSSAGCGVRLVLRDNLFLRYEIGWPLQGKPVDGKSVHQWLQVSTTF